MNTSTTGPISSGSASLAITNQNVIAGVVGAPTFNQASATLQVYGLTPDGTVAGAFLTATANFVGTWTLTRHTSGIQCSVPLQQILARGDQISLQLMGAAPFLNLTALDTLTLIVTACAAGSMALTLVQ